MNKNVEEPFVYERKWAGETRRPLCRSVTACCLPALEFRNTRSPHDVMWGANAHATGWSGIFAGVFAWYANLF